MHRRKAARHATAQTAIEYMVTYSWMFVILVIVISVLYEYGVIGGATSTGNICVPAAGFSCSTPTLNSSGTLMTAMSQQNTLPMYITGTACNTNSSTPSTFLTTAGSATLLYPGHAAVQYLFDCPVQGTAIGVPFRGNLWFEFNNGPGTGTSISKVATVQTEISSSEDLYQALSYVVYNPTCLSNTGDIVTYTQSTTLTCDILAYDININTGVALTTEGHSLIAYNSIDGSGNIYTNNVPLDLNGYGVGGYGLYLQASTISLHGLVSTAGGTGMPGSGYSPCEGGGGGGGAGAVLAVFQSSYFISSFNISGGANAVYTPASTSTQCGLGGSNTLASGGTGPCVVSRGGSGTTPSPPSLTSSLIQGWYNSGMINYLSGASGGNGFPSTSYPNSYGGSGGGQGSTYTGENCYAGGVGGSGQVITYKYTTAPVSLTPP